MCTYLNTVLLDSVLIIAALKFFFCYYSNTGMYGGSVYVLPPIKKRFQRHHGII